MHYQRFSFLFLLFPLMGLAATLPAASWKEWQAYTSAASGEAGRRAVVGKPFLRSDEFAEFSAEVRSGGVATFEPNVKANKHLPLALIHHWVGAIFIPHVDIQQVEEVLRDYSRYKDMYRPTVQTSSRIGISKDAQTDSYRSVMAYKSYLLKTAFETDYEVSYSMLDPQRGYSQMRSTRVQEIDQLGLASQHYLPQGEGSGIIWSLFGLTRFVERDGGVILEVEAIGLSRGIPGGMRWLVQPIVRRVLREALATSLRQTKESIEARVRLSVLGTSGTALPVRVIGSH